MNPKRIKVERQLVGVTADLFQRLKQLFSQAPTKGRFRFYSLRLVLGEEADPRPEFYLYIQRSEGRENLIKEPYWITFMDDHRMGNTQEFACLSRASELNNRSPIQGKL